MDEVDCKACLLHSGIEHEQKAICAKVAKVEKGQELMWQAIARRTPLWAFIGTIGIVLAIFGHLYVSTAAISDLSRENNTVLKSELRHINQSLRELKGQMHP